MNAFRESASLGQRPDPRDIAGMVDYMDRRLDILTDRFVEFAEAMSLRSYTVDELAALQGVSASTLRNSPWKLPHYGRADIGGAPRRWLATTCRAWYARPEDERRSEWDAMSSRERRSARGLAS